MKYIYDIDIWEYYKKDGMWKFILKHYLPTGLIIGVIFPLIVQLINFYAFNNAPWEISMIVIWHIFSIIIIPLIYLLYGYIKWHILNKRFESTRKF